MKHYVQTYINFKTDYRMASYLNETHFEEAKNLQIGQSYIGREYRDGELFEMVVLTRVA